MPIGTGFYAGQHKQALCGKEGAGPGMTETQAQEIAALLNERNQLAKTYTARNVLPEAGNYEYKVRDGKVVACVERKKVQWYQWEICHLSVAREWEGKGLAFIVYQRAEEAARSGGACILQCTIREGNERSERFCAKRGFVKVGRFFNTLTGNTVGVWQKMLSAIPPPRCWLCSGLSRSHRWLFRRKRP